MPPKPKAYIFDAYGTLFDVDSVMRRESALQGDLQALSQLWRRKQLEYTWQRALMERYEDFRYITEAALKSAMGQLSIQATPEQIESLMQSYLCLDAFDDAKPALESLRGSPLAILSNGTPAMLESLLSHSGLKSYFTEVISVDRLRTYKPSPRVYALGPEILKLPAQEILFVSSNQWDAVGAKAFGYQVCWCNRSGAAMENLGFAPDRIIRGLASQGKSEL